MMQHAMICGAAVLLSCGMATAQTITGAATDARGFKLYLYISGMGTNGTFSLGWPTNNLPLAGQPKVLMISAKPGFQKSGDAVLPVHHYHESYGGARIRWPYPAHAHPEAELTETGVRVAVSLTDYVAAEDTNLVVQVAAGLYSQGGTNSAEVASLAVTNLSTLSYSNVSAIANWSRTTAWNR